MTTTPTTPSRARIWATLLLSVSLLTACGTGSHPTPLPTPTPTPAPVPTPAPTPAPVPAPTLSLGTAALSMQASDTARVEVQVNRVPDQLQVSGAPQGISATASATSLVLTTKNALPGSYTITLTGIWGSETRSVTLPLTVVAPPTAPTPTPTPVPTPTPTPTPVAPDFALSLDRQSLSLTAGSTGQATVVITPNATFNGSVNLSASSSAATLKASLTNNILTVDATAAAAGQYSITVTGTQGSLSHSVVLPVTVSAQPVKVDSVTVTAPSSVGAGSTVSLSAKVQGSGNFNPGVTWKVSGGEATLTTNTDGSATLNVPSTAQSGSLSVTATSLQDPSKSGQASITVKALPQTVTLSATSLTLDSGATGTVNYSGQVVKVTPASPPRYLASLSAQNGVLTLVAGSVAGTEQLRLNFVMQDGGTQTATLQVTVNASAAPTPTPGGYVWYPESSQAASADELEVLRLTNQVRAAGATCGGTAYAPAPALTWNDKLAHAARNHSLDMGKRGYFEHTTPEGVTFSTRMTEAGYSWSRAAENIAAGYPSPQAVVDGWVKSPGHCVNLMNPNLKELGVGAVNVPGSPYTSYWTQDFGTPR